MTNQDNKEQKPAEDKVSFDLWYGARSKRIPSHHYKEILKADFKARMVPTLATMAEFDAALSKYGVKLA
jgi:hypothetical protein